MKYKLDPPQGVTPGPSLHPGSFIRHAILEPYGLNVVKAAALLQVSRLGLTKTLAGAYALTADLAYRIEALTGVDADLLIAMQAAYERDRDAAQRAAYKTTIERLPPPADAAEDETPRRRRRSSDA